MCPGMLKLQNCLAVKEVVSGKKQVQTGEICPQHSHLSVVKLREERLDRIGRQHGNEAGQQGRQLGTHFCQLFDCLVRGRETNRQFQIQNVTVRVEPFRCGIGTGQSFNFGMKRDAVK